MEHLKEIHCKTLKSYINHLNKNNIKDMVEKLSDYVLSVVKDPNIGMRFVNKNKFLKDFGLWEDVDEQMAVDYEMFNLDECIPDDKYVDAKFITVPFDVIPYTEGCKHVLWLINIHKDSPLTKIRGESMEDTCRKVKALCKTGILTTDDESVLIAGVILYGGEYNIADLIRHELVHYIIEVIQSQIGTLILPKDYKFQKWEVDEFIADYIPFILTTKSDNKLQDFKDNLYVKFNPPYSNLYMSILKELKL